MRCSSTPADSARAGSRGTTGYSLWCGGTGSPVDLEQGPTLVGHAVPPFYLVGAGAVGQGLLAILGVSGVQTFVVTIDDDVHDGTNLNRCFIAGTADVPRPKVDAVARYCSLTGLAGAEFAGTLSQFVVNGPLVEMPPAMREAQAEERFELIVSAVDKNTSRADVQGVRPELVVGGSTDQLTARAMTYGLRAGDPCLACYNPPEVVGVVRGKLDRRIRELTEIDGRAMLADKGLDAAAIDAVIDHVRKSPICGSAGDQALGVLAHGIAARVFGVLRVAGRRDLGLRQATPGHRSCRHAGLAADDDHIRFP